MSVNKEVARRFGTWALVILPTLGIASLYLYWRGLPAGNAIVRVVVINAFAVLNILHMFLRMRAVNESAARLGLWLVLLAGCAYPLVRGVFQNSFEHPAEVVAFFFYYACGVAALNVGLLLLYRPAPRDSQP
jgi:hypothetical protein